MSLKNAVKISYRNNVLTRVSGCNKLHLCTIVCSTPKTMSCGRVCLHTAESRLPAPLLSATTASDNGNVISTGMLKKNASL